MSALPVNVTITIEPVSCGCCQGWFGLDAAFVRNAKEDGRQFACPYCAKSIGWSDTANARLEREKADLARRLTWAQQERDRAIELRDRTERRRRAVVGVLTKVRKRVGHGVCPVAGCQRHFANLGRHMTTQHPGYQPDAEVG